MNSKQLNNLQIFGIIFSAILLVFLYSKSIVNKEKYYEIINSFNKIKELNSKLYGDVFLTRYNQIRHYDLIREDLESLTNISEKIHPEIQITKNDELREQWGYYLESLQQKDDQLNDFISHYAVFKSFINHYPKLCNDLYRDFHEKYEAFSIDIIKLQNAILLINKEDIFLSEQQINNYLSKIESYKHLLGKDSHHRIEHLIKYTNKIIFFSNAIRKLEDDLMKIDINNEVNLLITAYTNHFINIENSSKNYQLAMMILSLLLLAWLIYFLKNLQVANKKINSMLRELNFQKSALDEHAIVSITDLKGNIVYINEKFMKISQYSKDELLKKNHRVIKSDEHDNAFFKELWETIKEGKIWHGEVKNRKKDGSFYWVRASVMPILDDNGKPFQYISIRTDITEQKMIEKELQKAKTEAIKANEIKSQFLANMSHEIRTPLNAIIGFSDILSNMDLQKEQHEYSVVISRSAKSLLDIINDVLDISKIESGKLEIIEDTFELPTFLEHLVQLFSVQAKEKSIQFLYENRQKLPQKVYFDAIRLRQILSNLLSNAIKFTPNHGQVTFKVLSHYVSKNQIQISFIIKDTGIGIPKEKQKHIFEPFSQAEEGTTKEFGGTGLGLSICNELAKLLNSTINLTSEPNEGSQFSLTFDMKAVEQSKLLPTPPNVDFFISSAKEQDKAIYQNIQQYLKKIGTLLPLETTSETSVPLFFCFDIDDIEVQIDEFIKKYPKGKIVFVGGEDTIKDSNYAKKINHFIEAPIYESKIFNIIADNTPLPRENLVEKETKTNSNVNILVAEDNPNNQLLIKILLKKQGCNATIVNNGLEAVNAYKDDTYNMIFMDINMPKMDGITATKEIRRLEKSNKNTPIIALTANSIEGDKEKYLSSGMNDYLSKPIKIDELTKIIKKYS